MLEEVIFNGKCVVDLLVAELVNDMVVHEVHHPSLSRLREVSRNTVPW